MQGIDQGFSQVARKGTSGDSSVVWNFPVDVTFKSTNPFGWPRIVISVYSQVRVSFLSLPTFLFDDNLASLMFVAPHTPHTIFLRRAPCYYAPPLHYLH